MSSIEAAYLQPCDKTQDLTSAETQLVVTSVALCGKSMSGKRTHPYDDPHFAVHLPSLFQWHSTHCSEDMDVHT